MGRKKDGETINNKRIIKNIKKEERLVFYNFRYLKKNYQLIFSLIITGGIIFVWRGLWNMIDLFWFPSYPMISNIRGIILGMLLLFFSHRLIGQLVS